MSAENEKKSPGVSEPGDLPSRLRRAGEDLPCPDLEPKCALCIAARLLFEAADELEGVRTRGAGVATLGDVQRAQAFFAAWVSAPVTARILSSDAVQALAQAFADEREAADKRAAWLAERLEASNARLRETIGIASGIAKLMPQISAALDEYARPVPQTLRACGSPFDSNGEAVVVRVDGLLGRPFSACELPAGHRGPHGASR